MRIKTTTLLVICGLFLSLTWTAIAQVKQDIDSAQIRGKIERLENTELKSKSQLVQEVYKVSLLRLYVQYISALQQDMADLKQIQSTIGEPDANIASKIQESKKELDITVEKVRILKGEVQSDTLLQSSIKESLAPISRASHSEERPLGTVSQSPAQAISPVNLLANNLRTSTTSSGYSAPVVSDSLPAAERNRSLLATLPQAGTLEIKIPSADSQTFNGPTNLYVKVTDNSKAIKYLNILVIESKYERSIVDSNIEVDYNQKDGLQKTSVKLAKGTNKILVIALDKDKKPIEAVPTVARTLACEGDECGKGATGKADVEPVSTIATNSLNTRAIIGFEQAGASSSNSESRPFFDLYFTAPLVYSRKKPNDDDKRLPYFSAWGNVRLASVTQQVSAFGTFAANFIGPLAEGKINDLVQGFDFMVGPEIRLFKANGSFLSLIPGVRERTSFNFIMGFGAISPISPRKSAQIFLVPPVGNPQRAAFLEEFPEADGKTYIAYVSPDRDRFLRQYYGGFRLKTYFLSKNDKGEETFINRFPAIFDITLGQSDAVTGGKLHNFVIGFDGVYPLPIKATRFIYLFGTAKLKVGGGKIIKTPFILDTAPSTVTLTNNDLTITASQANRDFYRLGIGVNLTELFNRPAEPEKKNEEK